MSKYEVSIPFGQLSAKSFRHFVDLCKSEQEFWAPAIIANQTEFTRIQGFQHWTSAPHNLWRSMLEFWETIVDELNHLDGRSFPKEFEKLKENIESRSDIPPSSKSHLAFVIKDNWDTDIEMSRALVWGYTSSRAPNLPMDIRHGQNEAYYRGFALGLYKSIVAQEYAIKNPTEAAKVDQRIVEKVAQDLGVIADEVQHEVAKRRTQVKAFESYLSRRVKVIHKKLLTDAQDAFRKEKEAFELREESEIEALGQRETKFEELINLYEAQLRLRHPAKMWSDRQSTHQENSDKAWTRFRMGAGAFFVLAGLFVYLFGDWVAESFIPGTCLKGTEPSCGSISAKGPLVVATILTILTLGLWYLRLQMKLFLSERHLALDARERSAFSETYLSLVQQKAISSDQEVVVLQSLFRPTQDGIIQDDSGPDFAVAGLLAKALEKK